MRTLHFQQITDSRFEDDIENKLKDRIEQLRILLNTTGIERLNITEPRPVFFEDGKVKQYRSDFYIIKNNKITWNKIYGIVNSIKAVPYKFL